MFARGMVFACTIAALTQGPVCAQAVVSVRSGVINFFEGSVLVDGHRLEPKFGKFYDVKEGSKLWTEDGRAEVLLMPGAFLRVAEESSIRMVSTRLTDTRLEFSGGEIAIDSSGVKPAANASSPLHVTFKGYEISFSAPGRYRLSSAPAELRVHEGEAQVSVNGKQVTVKSAHVLPFSPALVAQSLDLDADDALDRWAKERSATIAADNAAAAASDNLSTALDTAPEPGSIFADIPLYAPVPGSSWSGYGPGYWGSSYYGYGGIYPLILGVPGYRTSVPRSPIWRSYRGPLITGPTTPFHPSPRGAMPTFRAPSAAPSMAHPPVGRANGHR
jgi:hypothetical protein